MIKFLPVLEGTQYEVVVLRDDCGNYEVEVRKPANTGDTFVEHEVVGLRYLDHDATQRDLERLVEEVIRADRPSLTGKYTGEKESE